MGEGGMVTTNDDQLAQTLRRLRNHGMIRGPEAFQNHEAAFDDEGNPNPWYYEMQELGYNYRASAIHCALGLSQLAKLDRFLAHRRNLAAAYDKALVPLAPAVRPIPRPEHSSSAWHLFVVSLNYSYFGITRSRLMRNLRRDGIGTQVHYFPLHRQPFFCVTKAESNLKPRADNYYSNCLSLPFFPDNTEEDVVARVVSGLVGIIKK
ncbi:MAG: UDP-4-amino-4,6-dideoxy-N-acetyl-beta-L-altrosamine transaminase, partial [Planctomycetaceae bacterium]|nr:UDP-4-amino-4,6-dideoxy-N-acetyl-beta-L-altrosamine transaminase [Planctomycetaceae bacterium]